MTIQDLFIEAYEDTNTSTANYPYSKALTKFNEIYNEVYRMIVTTQEDYFWTWWTTDLQQGTLEYKLEREWTTLLDGTVVPGIEKVKKVALLSTEENYSGMPIELPQVPEDEHFVSSGRKGWFLKDNHIFLNRLPTEEEAENYALMVFGIQNIQEISNLNSDVKDVIFPGHSDLKQFNNVLMHGLKKELREHKQDFEKADRMKARYEEGLEKMKRYITQRVQSIYYSDVQN